MLIKIIIKNKIEIFNVPFSVQEVIKNTLTLKNPLYFKMMRRGNIRALYAIPKDFKYYEQKGSVLYIGRGMQAKLINYLDLHCYEYTIKNETSKEKIKSDIRSSIKPRQYQSGDVEFILKNKYGIIKLGTGYGKTIIALQTIAKIKKTVLVIVPRDHLLQQFFMECHKRLKYKPGIIKGNKCEVREITIASIQTLVSQPEIALKYQNYFGMVIVDECHQMITKKRLNVIQLFNPEYLYGMTASPDREDGQAKAIEFTFGPVIIDKDIERNNPEVELISTGIRIPVLEN